MTQPRFAPITEDVEVRRSYRLGVPAPWYANRPADQVRGRKAPGKLGTGVQGPDQGYALRLAELLADRLVLAPGGRRDDVLAGAVAVGLRRAALFGRAPVLADLELALSLFGFLGPAREELVAWRARVLDGAAHDYWAQAEVAHLVPEQMLRSAPGASGDLLARSAQVGEDRTRS